MTYYAVTKGSYSDYHIVTITADKEKAEYIAKCISNEYDEAGVEEYEDCFITPHDDLKTFEVSIDYGCDLEINNFYSSIATHLNKVIEDNYDCHYKVCVQARDEEHAKKIACDLFAEYEAEKKGVKL